MKSWRCFAFNSGIHGNTFQSWIFFHVYTLLLGEVFNVLSLFICSHREYLILASLSLYLLNMYFESLRWKRKGRWLGSSPWYQAKLNNLVQVHLHLCQNLLCDIQGMLKSQLQVQFETKMSSLIVQWDILVTCFPNKTFQSRVLPKYNYWAQTSNTETWLPRILFPVMRLAMKMTKYKWAQEGIKYTWGIAQNRNIDGVRRSDMYFRQSSACSNALVTISFRHCTAFTEFVSYFKS